MKKNALLSVATLLSNLFSICLVIAFVAITGLFIHYQVRPSAYEGVQVDVDNQTFHYYKTMQEEAKSASGGTLKSSRTVSLNTAGPESGKSGKKIPIQQVHFSTLYFLYFKYAAVLALLFLIVAEIKKVLASVKELDTFRTGNVQSFRKIGFMCLGLSLVQWIIYFSAEGHSTIGFTVEVLPLVFMLAAFIMAEIFKEGNKLFEQDQLTI